MSGSVPLAMRVLLATYYDLPEDQRESFLLDALCCAAAKLARDHVGASAAAEMAYKLADHLVAEEARDA